jgi:two-component system response regulator AtoC
MMAGNLKIVVADDDQKILFAFREVLQKEGYTVIEALNGLEAIDHVKKHDPDLVFMDINMPGMDGLEALQQIKVINPVLPVIIITGEGTMHTAIRAMQYGAFQYLMKPLSVVQIREEISKAQLARKTTASEIMEIDVDPLKRHQLIGNSRHMQEIYKLIGSVCSTDNHTTVLITGETGTGKELVARAIHNNSRHYHDPFIAINCTAMPETLLESELFGHEKGAFTGAVQKKIGKFEVAGKGTIFLDEIGDLSIGLQKKLLRVLQEREFERLGDNTLISVGARFIAATNQNIKQKIKSGNFREDLYYRLNVVNIHLPALRERREDIALLTHFFLAIYNRRLNKNVSVISDELLHLLNIYDFPGNIRELENMIERAVMLSHGAVLQPDHLRITPGSDDLSVAATVPLVSNDFTQARDHILNLFEKQFLSRQLQRHGGNISEAAKASNMSRQNFHRLMVKHAMNKKDLNEV